ncbi:MAG: hypothetical protein HYW65_03895 [Candidatus Liptonbacteria bacterium]|nr:hypothetical protein [Candidatus Liptonbacteria bacterium]
MRFIISNVGDNMNTVMRRIGYHPIKWSDKGELNCVKPLMGQDYPRFHAYVKEEGTTLTFNLHLDQKRPSYGNETAHSGDYEGETVREEAKRIQDLLR